MPVAKSYQRCDIMGEPFKQNGRMYVTIETPFGAMKNVRWYTEAEYARMYPEAKREKPIYRNILGFKDAGYITIYYGNTYENINWFKASPVCWYHKIWGWYTNSDNEVPAELPEGVMSAKLNWEDVSNENGEVDEAKAAAAVEAIVYAKVNGGNFVGEIGEKYEGVLTVTNAVQLDGYYGTSTLHTMVDNEGNTFIWTTTARTLEKGKTYFIKGKIKDHKTYRRVNQTVLTNCRNVKEMECE